MDEEIRKASVSLALCAAALLHAPISQACPAGAAIKQFLANRAGFITLFDAKGDVVDAKFVPPKLDATTVAFIGRCARASDGKLLYLVKLPDREFWTNSNAVDNVVVPLENIKDCPAGTTSHNGGGDPPLGASCARGDK